MDTPLWSEYILYLCQMNLNFHLSTEPNWAQKKYIKLNVTLTDSERSKGRRVKWTLVVEPSISFSPIHFKFQSKLFWSNWYPVLKQYLYKHTAPPRPYTGRWVGIFSFRCQVFSNPIQSHYKHTAPVTNNTQHLGAAHKVYTWVSVTLSKIKGKGSFQIATKLACNGVICPFSADLTSLQKQGRGN